MNRVPLGGAGADYDSKKSRTAVKNMYLELDSSGEYRVARRTEGALLWAGGLNGPIRSNMLDVEGFVYFVAGDSLYRVDRAKNIENLGTVNGSGRAVVRANSDPSGSEILVLNGLGLGFYYDSGTATFAAITDVDFQPSSSATILNERFWLARDNTNQFFASAVSDVTSYPIASIATAEEHPDKVVGVLAKRSAVWVFGEKTVEYWQEFNDTDVPLRKVDGLTQHRGCAAVHSIADQADNIAWLADDGTVRMVSGTQMVKISDLELEERINGNGTLRFPGFTKIDDAEAFWIDSPSHKVYVLTFPTEKLTWCFDATTGKTHIRESYLKDRWRVSSAVSAFDTILAGDFETGDIYELTYSEREENSERLEAEIVTPALSFTENVTIPVIELDMEVGVGETVGITEPMIQLSTSKDGGQTWVNHEARPLGHIGASRTRVPFRFIGRLVRHKDLLFKFKVTDPVDVRIYGLYAQINGGR